MNKKTLFGVIMLTATLASTVTYYATIFHTSIFAIPQALQTGYEKGLTDMQTTLDKAGVFTSWTQNTDGSYTITLLNSDGLTYQYTSRFDMIIEQYRNGELISQSLHAMSVTNFGKDWVEQQLFSDVNSTDNALYISASNDETAFDAAWVYLPAEITSNGLNRALGTYTSTGVGTANVTTAFSISGTQSCCLYGINAGTYAGYPTSLIAAEQQGSGARKNLLSGDTLTITVQWSHS